MSQNKVQDTSFGQLALGLFVILVIAITSIGLLACVSRLAWRTVSSFFFTLSTLDAAIVVALITGAISVVTVIGGSVISGVLERRGKRREYLISKREEPYNQLISIIYDFMDAQRQGRDFTQEELLDRVKEFNKALTLWGSSKAIREWGKWRVSSGQQSPTPESLLFGMESVMRQLRKDVGQARLSKGDLLRLTVNDIDDILK